MKSLKWFLVALAFFLLTLVFVIVLMSKGAIPDAAMDNVSFASAVVSIALAVISIIISMIASAGTQSNLNSMREVERKLNESIDRLKNIKQDITNFRNEIVPNPFGNPGNTARGARFTMLGYASDNINDKPGSEKTAKPSEASTGIRVSEYARLSEEALDRVESIFGCVIRRDYRLKNIPDITFDGYTTIAGEPYVFEVKVAKSPGNILRNFRAYLEKMTEAFDSLRLNVSVVIVAVCDNENDKNATLDLLTRRLFFPRLNLSVLCFSKSELEPSTYTEQ